jgi:hypothetical protein
MFSDNYGIWGLGALIGLGVIYLCLPSEAVSFNQEQNFEKVKSAMTVDEVMDLLGAPTRENRMAAVDHGDQHQYELIWRFGKTEYSVFFVNDHVMSKRKR